jgi:RimJ/RimL family protein N-acetyltransferase
MNAIIETSRLILRLFEDTEADTALLYELNRDPEVTRYTHDPMRDVHHARKVLQEVILPQYALYNLGRWAVHIKPVYRRGRPDHTFIGWCGLKYRTELNEVDLGYRFMKTAWGKGYATEAAFASIHHGFSKLGLKEITGRALPGNLPSMRVLEKCGLSYVGEEVIEGYLHKTYRISNPVIQ